MRKTEKCYHYFIGLSIGFGILSIYVFIRLHSRYNHELFEILTNCQYPLLVGFVLSTSVTIALKSIIEDLEWTLANLQFKTKDLKKKLLDLQEDE